MFVRCVRAVVLSSFVGCASFAATTASNAEVIANPIATAEPGSVEPIMISTASPTASPRASGNLMRLDFGDGRTSAVAIDELAFDHEADLDPKTGVSSGVRGHGSFTVTRPDDASSAALSHAYSTGHYFAEMDLSFRHRYTIVRDAVVSHVAFDAGNPPLQRVTIEFETATETVVPQKR